MRFFIYLGSFFPRTVPWLFSPTPRRPEIEVYTSLLMTFKAGGGMEKMKMIKNEIMNMDVSFTF